MIGFVSRDEVADAIALRGVVVVLNVELDEAHAAVELRANARSLAARVAVVRRAKDRLIVAKRARRAVCARVARSAAVERRVGRQRAVCLREEHVFERGLLPISGRRRV